MSTLKSRHHCTKDTTLFRRKTVVLVYCHHGWFSVAFLRLRETPFLKFLCIVNIDLHTFFPNSFCKCLEQLKLCCCSEDNWWQLKLFLASKLIFVNVVYKAVMSLKLYLCDTRFVIMSLCACWNCDEARQPSGNASSYQCRNHTEGLMAKNKPEHCSLHSSSCSLCFSLMCIYFPPTWLGFKTMTVPRPQDDDMVLYLCALHTRKNDFRM